MIVAIHLDLKERLAAAAAYDKVVRRKAQMELTASLRDNAPTTAMPNVPDHAW
jgi:hypothetical protein